MAVPNSALVNGKMINGSCRELDCRCQMYRSCGEENNFFCAACHHDESFHEIIGVVEGEKIRYFGFAAAPVAPVPLPLPLVLKQTVEGQRRAIFQSGSSGPVRSTGGTKRPLSRGADRPPRTSMGSTTSRSSELNTTVHIVVMERSANVPRTHLERVEIRHDYFENITLSTARNLMKDLKISSIGDQIQGKFHIFVMHGKRTIRPTKFWSQEFPDATEIDALCRLKIIFVTSDCYEDEEKYFALIADADYVEVISPPRAASSDVPT